MVPLKLHRQFRYLILHLVILCGCWPAAGSGQIVHEGHFTGRRVLVGDWRRYGRAVESLRSHYTLLVQLIYRRHKLHPLSIDRTLLYPVTAGTTW